MPTDKKRDQVAEIEAKLAESAGVYAVNYRGLTVGESQELRVALREAGAEMRIFKNNLAKIALANRELPTLDEYLAGPTGFVFYETDPVAPAKALKEFAKENPELEIKGGLSDGHVVGVDEIKAIADLPSREELIAKLLGTLQNPLSQVVRVLNGPAESFARVVSAIADQKNAA